MLKIQQSKVGMISLVDTTLTEAPPEIITEMTGIVPKITLLNGKVVLIRDNIVIQESNRKGTAVEKKTKRGTMVDKTLYLSTKGASFAFDTNNPVLLLRVEVAPSLMTVVSAEICAAKCKDIHDALLPYAAELAAYGITNLTLSDQLQSVNEFISFINMPRTTYEQRKQATKNIAVLIKDCDNIFEGTDRAVRGVKTTFPEFYTKYFNDREIYNLGSRALSVRGKALTAEGLPLNDVTLKFGENNTVKSTEKGNFQVKHLPPGVWVVTCSRPGYVDYKTTIVVIENKRTELIIVMEPTNVQA